MFFTRIYIPTPRQAVKTNHTKYGVCPLIKQPRIPANRAGPARQQPSYWQWDVQFVCMIAHEGRLYGSASSL